VDVNIPEWSAACCHASWKGTNGLRCRRLCRRWWGCCVARHPRQPSARPVQACARSRGCSQRLRMGGRFLPSPRAGSGVAGSARLSVASGAPPAVARYVTCREGECVRQPVGERNAREVAGNAECRHVTCCAESRRSRVLPAPAYTTRRLQCSHAVVTKEVLPRSRRLNEVAHDRCQKPPSHQR